MHLKVSMKLEKTLKTLSSGQKNPKNPKKPKKKPKNPKKPLGWVFFKKTGFFSNPEIDRPILEICKFLTEI
jgi:hypothetical protein